MILSYPLSYRLFLFKLISDNFSDSMNDDAECEDIHLALKFTLEQAMTAQRRYMGSIALPPAAAHLLRLWVRIPPGAWIFVCCECRVLSGRGLCDELITRPEESYLLWCVIVCDLETLRIGAPYIYI